MSERGRRFGIVILIVLGIIANFITPWKVDDARIDLAAEPIFELGSFTITNTLLCAWLSMLLLLALAVASQIKAKDVPAPHSLQNMVEMLIEALAKYTKKIAGTYSGAILPLVGTFFLFIVTNNWLGLLPGFGSLGIWETVEGVRVFVPLLRGAASDLSTTLALAIFAVGSCQVYGIGKLGLVPYLSRFLAIGKFLTFFGDLFHGRGVHLGLLARGVLDLFIGALEAFEEITKIVSFAFRLFGNVFGGEVLLSVMAYLVPYVASLPFIALELFTGFIQGLIFITLTSAFLARAMTSHGHKPARTAQDTLQVSPATMQASVH